MRGYSAVGIINSKTELNVGGALRAAHCYGASLVLLQGRRYKTQASDTTKMSRHVPLIETTNVFDAVPYNCVPVAVEFIKEATALPAFYHPERALYIFGPEDGNIPSDIISRCRHVVYVPTSYCMNLASTVNVVLYDRLVKRDFRSGNSSQETELALDKASHADERLAVA